MALLDPDIGAPLTFEDVKRLVEAASPAVELQLDAGGKGRILVARKALKSGEIVLSEHTLFSGRTHAEQSRKACTEAVASLAKDVDSENRHAEFEDEDCLHPCSPLVDCLSDILLTRSEALHAKDKTDMARAKLKIRQLAALARTSVTEAVSDEYAQEILDLFLPEALLGLDKDELRGILHAINSNRFSGIECQLDLMFAGSMFEHSCEPNCFAGNWRRHASQPRLYRALRDIEVGEALSISYMQMPDLYLPFTGRAVILSAWGFSCTCPRCTRQPELTRAFVCPACSAPELCPTLPGLDVQELRCQKCEHNAEAAYVTRCLQVESLLDRLAEGSEEPAPSSDADAAGDANLISCFHHAAFRVPWQTMQEGPSVENLFQYAGAIEDIILCISRLTDAKNPNLLELYHTMATLETGNMESQQHFLELERAVMMHHYPEEVEKQDGEIWNLCQGRGPHTRPEDMADTTDLDGMD